MDLAPPIGQWVPVEGVGRRVVMGQRVVVRRWQRGPQSWLAVVVRRTWKRGRRNRHQDLQISIPGTLHLWGGFAAKVPSVHSDCKPQTRGYRWGCIEHPRAICHKQIQCFNLYLLICINERARRVQVRKADWIRNGWSVELSDNYNGRNNTLRLVLAVTSFIPFPGKI